MNKIVLKNSSVPGAIPSVDDLVLGEVAINIADGRLFTRRGDEIVGIATSIDLRCFARITGDVGYIDPRGPQESMTLKGGAGIKITAMHATNDIRIDLNNADAATLGGHASSHFATAAHLHDDRYVIKNENGGDYYTQAQVDANIRQAIDDLIHGAGSAYDTLKELESALLDNDSDIAAINSTIATKLSASSYTARDVLAKLKTVAGHGSGLDADKLDGQDGSFYRNAANLNTGTVPAGRLSGIYDIGISGNAATASRLTTPFSLRLSGDVTGSVSTDGSSGITLNATVINDSHSHDTRYFTRDQSNQRFIRSDASSTIRAGANTSLTITASDNGNATLSLHGDAQGTGRVFVGQDSFYGGGIEYNGDGAPGTSGAGGDYITLWRRSAGVDHWTARNLHNTNIWEFRETPKVGSNPVWHAGNTGEFAFSGQDFKGRGKRCIVASTSSMILNYGGDFSQVDIHSSVSVSGAVTATTLMNSAAFNMDRYTRWEGSGVDSSGGGAAFVNDNSTYKSLMILGNRSAGGNRIVRVWDELQCVGDIKAYTSDARLKENVETIEGALDKISKIRGVTYDWIEGCKEMGFCPANPHEHGVIAQEISPIIPDAVSSAPFNSDYLTVRYERIVPLLIEAVKEEREAREMLQQRVARLEKDLEVVDG